MEENNYINNGNAGIVGPNGKVINSKIEQALNVNEAGTSEIEIITNELEELLKNLKQSATKPEHFSDCAIVAEAQEVAQTGDKNKTFEVLKKSSKWVFDTATKLGIELTAAFLKEIMMK